MEEQLISFNTAKLAKEKSFDWKVRYSYGHKINPHIAYPTEDYSIPSDFNSPNRGRNWSHLYSAPTQSLLQKWLREIHKIDVIVQPQVVGYYSSIFHPKIFIGIFTSYEEALEIGLQEALKLIKL